MIVAERQLLDFLWLRRHKGVCLSTPSLLFGVVVGISSYYWGCRGIAPYSGFLRGVTPYYLASKAANRASNEAI